MKRVASPQEGGGGGGARPGRASPASSRLVPRRLALDAEFIPGERRRSGLGTGSVSAGTGPAGRKGDAAFEIPAGPVERTECTSSSVQSSVEIRAALDAGFRLPRSDLPTTSDSETQLITATLKVHSRIQQKQLNSEIKGPTTPHKLSHIIAWL